MLRLGFLALEDLWRGIRENKNCLTSFTDLGTCLRKTRETLTQKMEDHLTEMDSPLFPKFFVDGNCILKSPAMCEVTAKICGEGNGKLVNYLKSDFKPLSQKQYRKLRSILDDDENMLSGDLKFFLDSYAHQECNYAFFPPCFIVLSLHTTVRHSLSLS